MPIMKDKNTPAPSGGPLESQSLADFYNCDRSILTDTEKIEAVLTASLGLSEEFPLETKFYKTERRGIYGILLARGLVITVRTDAENKFLALDISFSAGRAVIKRKSFDDLKRALGSKTFTVFELGRGFISPVSE